MGYSAACWAAFCDLHAGRSNFHHRALSTVRRVGHNLEQAMDDLCKRLCFRAWRRGFRELDLILGPFADAQIAQLDQHEIAELELLLDAPDQDVYSWIIGRSAAPAQFEGGVMRKIRAFAGQMARPAQEMSPP